ncbi:MAG TPA: apolipoprotein N-acyltransferase [Gammaproteobacteria bacterium]|nr:apolipoprotein N-acyltransferase [Gammaproteobacteria bacterium]
MKINAFLAPGRLGNLVALLAGILMIVAFAPCGFFVAGIIMPAILFMLWQSLTPQKAFLRGWLFGLGLFGTGVYWVFISIHTYGNASVFLASFFTVSLISILALFPALTGWFLNRYFPIADRSRLFYAFPALWVLFEWIRSWIFTGFPWLLLGDTQIHSPLKGYAPIVSVYGLSFLVLLNSGLLIELGVALSKKQIKKTAVPVLILLVIWVAGAGLARIAWTHPVGSPVKVSLVQGNIPQETKWSFDNVQTSLDTYSRLTRPHWDSDIIIWPESAITLSIQDAEDFLNTIVLTARKHHTTFITGIPVQAPFSQSYYNAVITLGNGYGYYFKRRLVPFGEYTPFREWLSKLLDGLKIPMSDFIPGTQKTPPLVAGNIHIAPFICYEIAFPEMVLSRDKNINLLLTISNDAWFGHSIAQAEHLAMAEMRAAENRRPLLFVSNNGITAVIDAKGNVHAAAPPYVATVLTDTVQPVEGLTPWQRMGMDPILFLMVMLIIYAIREQRHLKRK